MNPGNTVLAESVYVLLGSKGGNTKGVGIGVGATVGDGVGEIVG